MTRTMTVASIAILITTGLVALPASAQSWKGAYVGGTVNFGPGLNHARNLSFDTNLDGQYGDTVKTSSGADYFTPGFCDGTASGSAPAAGCTETENQAGSSFRAGYDWQTGAWVYGAVAEISTARYQLSASGFSSAPDAYTFTQKVTSVSALRARLGYARDTWLVYGTAGYAYGRVHSTFSTTNALNAFSATNVKNNGGFQGGFGFERQFGPNWTVGAEYLHTSLDAQSPTVLASGSKNTFASNPFLIGNAAGTDIRRGGGTKITANVVSLAVNYRFGAMW